LKPGSSATGPEKQRNRRKQTAKQRHKGYPVKEKLYTEKVSAFP